MWEKGVGVSIGSIGPYSGNANLCGTAGRVMKAAESISVSMKTAALLPAAPDP